MKAEDLMIGDLVYYSYPNSFVTKVIDVCSHGEEHFIRCKRDAKDNLYKQDQLEDFNVGILRPIPLTPEILEKNGFIQDTNYSFRFFSPKVYKTIDIGVDFTIKGFTFWYSDTISISCGNGSKINRLPCFVNELQHALKLCKIDKEIKL